MCAAGKMLLLPDTVSGWIKLSLYIVAALVTIPFWIAYDHLFGWRNTDASLDEDPPIT